MAWTMSKGVIAAFAVCIGAAVAAGGAIARDGEKMPAKANAAVRAAHVRHENFEKLGAAFKSLNDELRKPSPSLAVLKTSAGVIESSSRGLPTWFPRGSGVEARPKSEAKSEVWSDAAGFGTAASNFRAQAAKLNTAAATSVDAVKGEARPTFAACKGCHDKYRQQKKS